MNSELNDTATSNRLGPTRTEASAAAVRLVTGKPAFLFRAMQTSLIQNAHGDLVTDAAYDFYGVRLATCSLDHRIKIWQLDETEGTWTAVADWKVWANQRFLHAL
jgi:WD40 repeat protein